MRQYSESCRKSRGNIYENETVKASFKSDKGTYNSETKQVVLYDNVIMVYFDGTNIKTDRLVYSGKNSDIKAFGNVRIEKPNEAVVMGSEAVLSHDYKKFKINGRTQTHFYTSLYETNEKVGFHSTFSRHGRIEASFILLIWLNENVHFRR